MLWHNARNKQPSVFYKPDHGEDISAFVPFNMASQVNKRNLSSVRLEDIKVGDTLYYLQDRYEAGFDKGLYLCFVTSK
jgi:hypothetical protein